MNQEEFTRRWDRENGLSRQRLGIFVWLTPWQFHYLARAADAARVTMEQAMNAAVYALVREYLVVKGGESRS